MTKKKRRRTGVYREGDGYCFRVRTKQGAIYRSGFETEKQAADARLQALAGLKSGTLNLAAERTTFAEFVNSKFTDYSAAKHSPQWHKNVTKYYLPPLIEAFGARTFAEITSADCEQWLLQHKATKTIHGKARSNGTVNRSHAVLSSVFSLAFRAGIIRENPCARVDSLTENAGRTRELPPRRAAKSALTPCCATTRRL